MPLRTRRLPIFRSRGKGASAGVFARNLPQQVGLSGKSISMEWQRDPHLKTIEHIVQTALYPDELYEQFLVEVTACLDAQGAAIWHLQDPGEVNLSAAVGFSDACGRQAWERHRTLVADAINGQSGPKTISPDEPWNDSGLMLLLQKVHGRCPLWIEIAHRPDAAPPSLSGHSKFLKLASDELAKAKCIPWE
jgi:hypothetical protein